MTMQNPDSDYSGQPYRSGMARASMILGIIGLFTGCIGIGIILSIISVILGIIALTNIGRQPQTYFGKGYAITGIVTSIIGVVLIVPMALMVAILLPSLGKARELANRSYCVANLRGIAQSLNVYAADNSDRFPAVPGAPYAMGNSGVSSASGAASVPDTINLIYSPAGPQNGSPLAGPWLLVLKNYSPAKQFVCKSDPFVTTPASLKDASGNYYQNFQATNQLSYSFAYPYTVAGSVGKWWQNTADSSLPVASDMAPLNGTGNPVRNVAPGSRPLNARTMNSGNHQGDGQNIAFADGHAEFARIPAIGQNNDNIFTYTGAKSVSDFGGTQPTKSPIDIQTDFPPYDTVMVPARDLNTGGF